jgi:hypothetical protein
MTAETIRAALEEMLATRKTCDEAIQRAEKVIAQMEGDRNVSYVQLAILVLQEAGRPMPITMLLDRIRDRRKDPTITRGALETSLLRHLSNKGERAEFAKPSPGTYVYRESLKKYWSAAAG